MYAHDRVRNIGITNSNIIGERQKLFIAVINKLSVPIFKKLLWNST